MKRGIFGVILLLTLIASLEAWTAEVPLNVKGKFTWVNIPGITSIGGSFTFKGSIDNNTLRGEGKFDGTLNFQYDLLPEFSIPIYAERVSCQYDKGKRQVKFEVHNVGIPGVVIISISFEINHSWWKGNIEINAIGIITLNGPVGGTVQKFELRSKPYLTRPSDPRSIGGETNEYEFVVAYHDLSGEEPEWVQLVLPQVCVPMKHVTGDPSSSGGSIYKAKYSLQCGSKVYYYFEAEYQYGTVRLPESGYFSFTPPCEETCELSVTADPIDTLEDTASEFRVHANPSDNPTLKFGIDQYPSHGRIKNFDSASGTGTYVPEEDYNGSDVFKVSASIKCGGKTLKKTAEVQVQIEPVDDPPEVREGVSLTVHIPQNTPKQIYLKDYVWDKDNDLSDLSFRITQYPKHGKVEGFDDDTGELTYEPNHNWHGTDYLYFKACDGEKCSETIKLSLVVEENQPPKAYSKDVYVERNTPKRIQLEAQDPEHDPLTFSIKTYPSHGQISDFDSNLGTLTYTPEHDYSGSDKFEFEVSDSQNSASAWIYITVAKPKPPQADAGGGYHAAVGEEVTLDASGSFDPDGNIVQYLWDLDDDGQFDDASGVTVTHVWNSPGTYTIGLKVIDNDDLSDTDTAQVVIGAKKPPVAGFTYSPTEVYDDTEVHFTDTSTDEDGQITSWYWDFGDGTTSNERNPVHKFEEGTYDVCLTVTDNDGLTDTVKKRIEVHHRPPKAISESYTLDEDSSTEIHLKGDKPNLQFEIISLPSHGKLDGTPPDVTYTPYPNYYGTDSFKFVVYDDKGARSDPGTISITVNPIPDPPKATPWQTSIKKAQQIEFTLNATDVDSTNLTFSIVDNPSHGTVKILDPSTGKVQYKPDPDYRGLDSFTFKVTDETDLSDTAQIKINVGVDNAAPIAQFTYSLGELQVGHAVVFDASTSYDPEGDAIVKYEWDFGDGTSAKGVRVSHVYNKSGTYKVTLIVTDEWNGKGESEKTLFIKPYNPGTSITAYFDFSPTVPKVGEVVTFDASKSSGSAKSSIITYKWDFGDGTKTMGKKVKHTYNESGWFTVKLLIKDSLGKEDVCVRNVYIGIQRLPIRKKPIENNIKNNKEKNLLPPGKLTITRNADGSVTLEWENRAPLSGFTVISRKVIGKENSNFVIIRKACFTLKWTDREAIKYKYNKLVYRVWNEADGEKTPYTEKTVPALPVNAAQLGTVLQSIGKIIESRKLENYGKYLKSVGNVTNFAEDFLKALQLKNELSKKMNFYKRCEYMKKEGISLLSDIIKHSTDLIVTVLGASAPEVIAVKVFSDFSLLITEGLGKGIAKLAEQMGRFINSASGTSTDREQLSGNIKQTPEAYIRCLESENTKPTRYIAETLTSMCPLPKADCYFSIPNTFFGFNLGGKSRSCLFSYLAKVDEHNELVIYLLGSIYDEGDIDIKTTLKAHIEFAFKGDGKNIVVKSEEQEIKIGDGTVKLEWRIPWKVYYGIPERIELVFSAMTPINKNASQVCRHRFTISFPKYGWK